MPTKNHMLSVKLLTSIPIVMRVKLFHYYFSEPPYVQTTVIIIGISLTLHKYIPEGRQRVRICSK